jgi:hypothetical protein
MDAVRASSYAKLHWWRTWTGPPSNKWVGQPTIAKSKSDLAQLMTTDRILLEMAERKRQRSSSIQ